MKALALLSLVASLNIGSAQQKPADKPKVSQLSQTQSLAAQSVSVRRQMGVDEKAAADGFFSVPWPRSAPLAGAQSAPADCAPMEPQVSDKLIEAAAKSTGLKSDLLHAVIQRESGFKPCAESVKGAQGLMQLMPATAQELGVQDPFDPKQNIEAGSKYLKQLVDKYGGDLKLALSAYNAGPSMVTAEKGIPDIPETREYVKDIMSKISDVQ